MSKNYRAELIGLFGNPVDDNPTGAIIVIPGAGGAARAIAVVGDVVFCPMESAFLKKCKDRGAKTIPGIDMLVEQGVLAYELWTGKKAPKQVMSETLMRAVPACLHSYSRCDLCLGVIY